jgi:DNA-binding NarL/FixJ family response regulator
MEARILLADDRREVRSALRLLIGQQPGLCVVAEVADATALAGCLASVQPDLVLIDWELPGLPTGDRLAPLRCIPPSLKIVVMSGRLEARRAALEAGADAFICKCDPPEHVLDALSLSLQRELST